MKTFVLTLALAPLLVSEAIPSRKADPIPRAGTAPIIDGRLNDTCWKQAKPIPVVYPHGGTGKTTGPVPMKAWMTWDTHYLYLAYEVNDTDLVALGTGLKTGPPKNRRSQSVEYAPEKNLDLAEFFISLGSNQFFWEIHHNAANHLNTLWIEIPTPAKLAKLNQPSYRHVTFHRKHYLPDSGTYTLQKAVSLKSKAGALISTINQPADRDLGYYGELRIPWTGLLSQQTPKQAVTKLNGMKLSLLVVNLNGNNGQAFYHSSGSDIPKLMYHFSVNKWPAYRFVD